MAGKQVLQVLLQLTFIVISAAAVNTFKLPSYGRYYGLAPFNLVGDDVDVSSNSVDIVPEIFMASPRQIFIPPPEPPCRSNYARIDGVCRPTFTRGKFMPVSASAGGNIFYVQSQQRPNSPILEYIINEVEVDKSDDADDQDNSLTKLDKEFSTLSNGGSGLRVPKRPSPSLITVPRNRASSTECSPGMSLDKSGACRRRFTG